MSNCEIQRAIFGIMTKNFMLESSIIAELKTQNNSCRFKTTHKDLSERTNRKRLLVKLKFLLEYDFGVLGVKWAFLGKKSV